MECKYHHSAVSILPRIVHNENTCIPYDAAPELIVYLLDEHIAGSDGFNYTFYENDLDAPCRLIFNRQYPIGSFITRANTPFPQWYFLDFHINKMLDILLMWKCCNGILNVQHKTLFCIITKMFYHDRSNRGGYIMGWDEYLVLVEGVEGSNVVLSSLFRNKYNFFLCSNVSCYFFTSVCSYIHLMDFQSSRYSHLKELMTCIIVYVFPNFHQSNDVNGFVRYLVN